ncbi:tetratricopeptide repeat protein [Azorhizobium doebereinerae]|uniref:O-linked N-acetylglucosamine transferase family protein n=1 Tax=Azorhizobium doebereinerae TaxID=281091 RepID=UPI0006884CAE|nr:tetratricopeptide repeat protein [Azorhizobium doebereinerae]
MSKRHPATAAFGTPAGGQMKSAQDALRAGSLHQAGDHAGAAKLYASSLKRDPRNAGVQHMHGLCLRQLGRLPEAKASLRAAATLRPQDAAIQADLGTVLLQMGDTAAAQAAFEQALKLQPGHAAAQVGLARLAAHDGTLDALRLAVAQQPANGEAALELGCAILANDGDPDAAAEVWAQAFQRGALSAERMGLAGVNAYEQGRDRESMALLKVASSLRPDIAALHANLGLLLLDKRRHKEAVEVLGKALAIDPNHVGALLNLGSVFVDGKRFAEALTYYRRAIAAEPDNVVARLGAANAGRQICQWRNVEADEAELGRLLAATDMRIGPFILLSSHVSTAVHLHAARVWARGVRLEQKDKLPPAPPADPARRIRIGYLSSDFHHHATAFLAVEMFERHDRAKFEVFAYSHSPDDKSAMRQRVIEAFDHFVEVGDMTNAEAARRIRADGIDILVDLKGYTLGCRTEIMALRPAPVQVNYLGYPGTMGADFIDYIIGDRVVTPLDHAGDYDEKIVQLPGAYQPNDSRRAIAESVPDRAACGLPESGFVFCCFNNTYKITPAVFAVWMRLLEAVPGSVLWLFEANATARDNLAYEAASAGLDPERIIFAPKLDLADHLARHAHADLFLDTLPYNAHTTASDALWAGVPVVTCAGESFASRVAASLLTAVGLPELVTTSLADYEALALALAQDPARLAALKARLAAARATAPLFDAAAYTAGIETAYERMHALRSAGKAPEAIVV